MPLQEEAQLFGPEVPQQLRKPWVLTTPMLATIDQDDTWLLSGTAQVLSGSLGLPPPLCTHTACMRVRLLSKPLSCPGSSLRMSRSNLVSSQMRQFSYKQPWLQRCCMLPCAHPASALGLMKASGRHAWHSPVEGKCS
jgi:hypothetical protein